MRKMKMKTRKRIRPEWKALRRTKQLLVAPEDEFTDCLPAQDRAVLVELVGTTCSLMQRRREC